MKIESIFGEACTACDACMNICPKNAITITEDKYGFYEPEINHDICIQCGLCDKVCPSLNVGGERPEYEAFCGYSLSDEVRTKSSSGGLFRAIANMVVKSGGIVFGAAFNYGQSDLRLEHSSSDDIGLEPLQKSKYVQSYIGLTYRKVKEMLALGRNVMFVGTPCQVAGLKSYLGKYPADNLLAVDFICHGVPSMHFLRDHLRHIGFENLSKIEKIDFRPKSHSWVDDLVIRSEKRKYQRFYKHDAYFRGFDFSYITLRKSCFHCNYCNGHNRKADITLADFWGIYKSDLKIDDWRKGLSLVLAYTEKGKEFLNKVDNVLLKPVNIADTEYIYRRDRAIYYPHEARQKFFTDYAVHGYDYAVENHGLKGSSKELGIYKFKQEIKKLLKKWR